MDSFELNKIIGAILGTLLFVMGVGFIAEAVYEPIGEGEAGYALPEPEAGATTEVAEVKETPISVLLASADASAGANVAKKCASCHNFEKGAGNKTGPDLYGVVGQPIGHRDDFNYSDAIMEHHNNDEVWSYEHLNAFLTSPKAFAPGTKMTFAGLRSEKDRANILAYLQTMSDNPVAFPEPPAEDEMAPADGDADMAPAQDTSAGETETTPAKDSPPAIDNAQPTETDTDGTVEDSNPAEIPAQ